MKNRFIYLVFTFIIVFISCDDLDDIHQKYLDEKPVAYLGITDSLTAYSGKERVKLVWYQSADPRLKQTVIYWNQRKDSVVIDISQASPEKQKDSIFISVPEGTYTFEAVNKGNDGEISIKQEVQGRSYGTVFEGTLRHRPLSTIRENASISGVNLTWENQVNKTRIGTEVKYRNTATGEWETHFLSEKFGALSLPNTGNRLWNPDDIIYITALHLPAGAVDTLQSTTYTMQGCKYMATEGKRREFNAEGVYTGMTTYTNLEKFIWYMGLNGKESLQCNRFGSFGIYTDFVLNQFLMTIENDYTINTTGFQKSNATTKTMDFFNSDKSDGNISTFDPDTGVLTLYVMRKTIPAGLFTVMEEVLTPVSTNP